MWVTRILSISLVTVGDPGTLTGGYLYHRRLAQMAPAHSARIEFISLPARTFPAPVLDARTVRRRSAAQGAAVLVLDSIAAAYLAPWLRAPSRFGVPVVAMIHQPPGGIDHGVVRTRLQALLDEAAYRRAQCLLVASDSLRDDIGGRGFKAPVIVVPPGRDPAAAPDEVKEDLRRGTSSAFLCVANWVERKNLLELLDAFARLPPGRGCLHLVGDRGAQPRYAARVRERLSRRDLAGRVIVHGRVTEERVAGLYEAADVFVLPSLKEPYGTVYGEAMASGLPVAGWRAGNLPYLADDQREGIVAPPGDVEALAAGLDRLAGDEALRRRMGDAARVRAQSFPTWEQTAELFFGALRRAIRE
jgi:glycosyltransferase involved in cell wall biosynthesis